MWTLHGDIVTTDRTLSGAALVIGDDGRIAEVGPGTPPPVRSGDIDATGFLVLPGFVDMHVHGGGGADFMRGTPDAARQAARTHARFGTTGLLATTLTASREDTDRAIQAVLTVTEQGRAPDEARLLGLHLEGPYICPARRGAQPAGFVRAPDVEEFSHWLSLSQGGIRQITLAPEMPGADAVIRVARENGVVVSLGHTDAMAEQVETAIGWGARQGRTCSTP